MRSSGYGIRGVLSQYTVIGKEQLNAFVKCSLNGVELIYATTEKRLLAIVYSLQKFQTHVQGTKLSIKTDRHASKFLKQCRLLNKWVTRWILFLQQFDIENDHAPVKGLSWQILYCDLRNAKNEMLKKEIQVKYIKTINYSHSLWSKNGITFILYMFNSLFE